ncbi:MAG: hypothetical protein R2932_53500 [Caldilineaceae bacterium]
MVGRIPGATLLGLAGTVFFDNYAPGFLGDLGGPIFLAAIGFGFILVYLADVTKWWAIIPAGVMATLALVAGLDQFHLRGLDTGGVFFLGLGGTFLVLALYPIGRGEQQRWAAHSRHGLNGYKSSSARRGSATWSTCGR